MVSPHILTNPTDPSPCHPHNSQLPLSPTPPFPSCCHRCRNRWRSFSAPSCPEVPLVLLRVADYWGGAARKASAPGPTDPLPAWGKVAAGKHGTLHLLKASMPRAARVQEDSKKIISKYKLHTQPGKGLLKGARHWAKSKGNKFKRDSSKCLALFC